jgi:hypothetical protein
MPYTAMIARLSPTRRAIRIAGVKNVFSAGAALTISFFLFDAIDWLAAVSVLKAETRPVASCWRR